MKLKNTTPFITFLLIVLLSTHPALATGEWIVVEPAMLCIPSPKANPCREMILTTLRPNRAYKNVIVHMSHFSDLFIADRLIEIAETGAMVEIVLNAQLGLLSESGYNREVYDRFTKSPPYTKTLILNKPHPTEVAFHPKYLYASYEGKSGLQEYIVHGSYDYTHNAHHKHVESLTVLHKNPRSKPAKDDWHVTKPYLMCHGTHSTRPHSIPRDSEEPFNECFQEIYGTFLMFDGSHPEFILNRLEVDMASFEDTDLAEVLRVAALANPGLVHIRADISKPEKEPRTTRATIDRMAEARNTLGNIDPTPIWYNSLLFNSTFKTDGIYHPKLIRATFEHRKDGDIYLCHHIINGSYEPTPIAYSASLKSITVLRKCAKKPKEEGASVASAITVMAEAAEDIIVSMPGLKVSASLAATISRCRCDSL